jgi:thioredoxin reductase
MQTWQTQMPGGMHLKSEGFASNLYEPTNSFTLESYCRERGIPYADVGKPVALETFIGFGLAFQERFVPELDRRNVAMIERLTDGFELILEDGDRVRADAVVIAVGISHFAHLPSFLSDAPSEYVTHTSAHNTLDRFRGRRVTVVGSGASAIDVAALLHEIGATTRVVARSKKLRFHRPPEREPRSLLRRIRSPRSGLGQGWKPMFSTHMPDVIYSLPTRVRSEVYRRTLGPAPCWFSKSQIVGKVSTELGLTPEGLRIDGGTVQLSARNERGEIQTFESDHIIAGTGYRVELSRLTFLSRGIRGAIRTVNGSPALSKAFETSIPGMYFTGLAAAQSFGPLLRFAYGAQFASQRLSKHFATRFA